MPKRFNRLHSEAGWLVMFRSRFIVVIHGLAFYCSTGRNSHERKTWFPFLGACSKKKQLFKPFAVLAEPYYPQSVIKFIKAVCPEVTDALWKRFGGLDGMILSMLIGTGFWEKTKGQLIANFLIQKFPERVKTFFDANVSIIQSLGSLSDESSPCFEFHDEKALNQWLTKNSSGMESRLTKYYEHFCDYPEIIKSFMEGLDQSGFTHKNPRQIERYHEQIEVKEMFSDEDAVPFLAPRLKIKIEERLPESGSVSLLPEELYDLVFVQDKLYFVEWEHPTQVNWLYERGDIALKGLCDIHLNRPDFFVKQLKKMGVYDGHQRMLTKFEALNLILQSGYEPQSDSLAWLSEACLPSSVSRQATRPINQMTLLGEFSSDFKDESALYIIPPHYLVKVLAKHWGVQLSVRETEVGFFHYQQCLVHAIARQLISIFQTKPQTLFGGVFGTGGANLFHPLKGEKIQSNGHSLFCRNGINYRYNPKLPMHIAKIIRTLSKEKYFNHFSPDNHERYFELYNDLKEIIEKTKNPSRKFKRLRVKATKAFYQEMENLLDLLAPSFDKQVSFEHACSSGAHQRIGSQ